MCWNVRGLNRPQKQREVMQSLIKNKVGLACLLETKIKQDKFSDLYTNVLQGWCVCSNFSLCKGGRILVIWLASCFQVDILETHE